MNTLDQPWEYILTQPKNIQTYLPFACIIKSCIHTYEKYKTWLIPLGINWKAASNMKWI